MYCRENNLKYRIGKYEKSVSYNNIPFHITRSSFKQKKSKYLRVNKCEKYLSDKDSSSAIKITYNSLFKTILGLLIKTSLVSVLFNQLSVEFFWQYFGRKIAMDIDPPELSFPFSPDVILFLQICNGGSVNIHSLTLLIKGLVSHWHRKPFSLWSYSRSP